MPEPTATPSPTFSLDPPVVDPTKVEPAKDGTPANETTPPAAPAAPAAPVEDPWKGKWQAHASEKFRSHPLIAKAEKLDNAMETLVALDAAKAELETKLKDAIFVPKEGASKEEVAAYRKAIGIPETAEAFNLQIPPEYNGILNPDEAGRLQGLKEFKEVMHDLGLTQKQAEQLFPKWLAQKAQDIKDAEAFIAAHKEETRTKLRKEPDWNTDEKEAANIAFADKFVNTVGGEEAWDYLKVSGLIFDPMLIKIFAKAGKGMSSDTTPPGSPPSKEVNTELKRDPTGAPDLYAKYD